MNKVQKLEYQQQIDGYMEKHQVYDLLQGLMKSLLQEKPEDPIDFLISYLKKPQPKRIFIVVPPRASEEDIVQGYSGKFECSSIIMSKMFDKQVEKKTPAGLKIEAARSISAPIDDETAIDLLTKKLKKHKGKGKDSIVIGFPLNITQALALQTKGMLPDKLIVMNSTVEVLHKLILPILPEDGSDREAQAKKLANEYHM